MPPSESASSVPFEQALSELERILRELEDGNTTLEDSLSRYERGVGLLRQCYGQLKDAEQRVKQLTGVNEDGTPELRPFEHTASIENAKAAVRRPAKPPRDSGIPE